MHHTSSVHCIDFKKNVLIIFSALEFVSSALILGQSISNLGSILLASLRLPSLPSCVVRCDSEKWIGWGFSWLSSGRLCGRPLPSSA